MTVPNLEQLLPLLRLLLRSLLPTLTAGTGIWPPLLTRIVEHAKLIKHHSTPLKLLGHELHKPDQSLDAFDATLFSFHPPLPLYGFWINATVRCPLSLMTCHSCLPSLKLDNYRCVVVVYLPFPSLSDKTQTLYAIYHVCLSLLLYKSNMSSFVLH